MNILLVNKLTDRTCDLEKLLMHIDLEAFEENEFKNEFNEKFVYDYLHPYDFFISKLRVSYFSITFKGASFIISDGERAKLVSISVDNQAKCFQDVVEQFKAAIRLHLFDSHDVKGSIKLPELLTKTICDRSENWVIRHGM